MTVNQSQNGGMGGNERQNYWKFGDSSSDHLSSSDSIFKINVFCRFGRKSGKGFLGIV